MYFAVLREPSPEARVALVPDIVRQITDLGHQVGVEAGAGLHAQYPDPLYEEAGAAIETDRNVLLGRAHVVAAIRAPDDLHAVRSGTILIALLSPLVQPDRMQELAGLGLASFSLDALPRISRAQSMDVLSAMSTVSGYRATIVAAERAHRFLPMLMTAAGTVKPARVLVLGAGVAGLQAVATAHRLGAVVQAFDARPVVKEQVESLGASFLTLPDVKAEGSGGYARAVGADEEAREQEFLAGPVRTADIVITTAMVPGRRAPLLITAEMVASMHPGAVIMDLAAETGGNTAVTVPGSVIEHAGVVVDGSTDWPSQMAQPASQLYSRNMFNFIKLLWEQGLKSDDGATAPTLPELEDEILRSTLITRNDQVVHEPTLTRLHPANPADAAGNLHDSEGGRD
ncbi:MAG: NAD(P) transhydrogenase subunit alpha [Clostridia bacterium]